MGAGLSVSSFRIDVTSSYHSQLGITPGLLILLNFKAEQGLKKMLIISLIIFHSHVSNAQEIPLTTEQQLENLTDANEGETEDDSYLQELEHFRRNPLNINTCRCR